MDDALENKNDEASDDLSDRIEQTAAKRAMFTRNFLADKNPTLADLVEKLNGEPFKFNIDPTDDKNLALGVFQLQKFLGFPEVDNWGGCDGKFGPYTQRAYEGHFVSEKSGVERAVVIDDGTVENTYKPVAIEPKKPEVVDKHVDLPTVKTSETVFVGDSLTVGMAQAGMLNGCINLYKGASSTNSRLPVLKRFLQENASAIKSGLLKRVVITLGTNDITNCRGKKDAITAIIGRIFEMETLLTSKGLDVVLNTIPYSDLSKRLNGWKNVHGDKYFNDLQSSVTADELGLLRKTSGSNNQALALAILKFKVEKVNEFIKSRAGSKVKVIDLYTETLDQQKYPLSTDGLHFTSSGYKAMAALIKNKGNIRDA